MKKWNPTKSCFVFNWKRPAGDKQLYLFALCFYFSVAGFTYLSLLAEVDDMCQIIAHNVFYLTTPIMLGSYTIYEIMSFELFFHFYVLNIDISLYIYPPIMQFHRGVNNILPEGTMSQISDLGLF